MRAPLPEAEALHVQRTAGNTAMVQMLRQAGHSWAQPDLHQHGPACGHRTAPSSPSSEAPAVQRSAVHDVLRTPGRPLDEATRTDMEARLGADFSGVRIHDDATAKASAAEVGARAYTSGSHVVIGGGGADEHTLAHELTHVIQQRQGPVAGTDNGRGLQVSDPSDRFEREAESNARKVMQAPVPVPAASESEPVRSVPEAGETAVQRMYNGGGTEMNPGFVPPQLVRQRTFDLSSHAPISNFLAHVPVNSNVQGLARYQDIWIGQMVISDTDRPLTQYLDAGQKNHTTAWTLIREALTSHSNKNAANLVSYIHRELGRLEQIPDSLFIQATQSAIPLYRSAVHKATSVLAEVLSTAAPVSEWGGALAHLVRLYIEAYQLNPAATFGGNSGGNSEGDRMAKLRRQESLSPAERMDPGAVWDEVRGLFEAPPSQEQLAYSEQSFWNTLATAFPGVTEHVGQLPGLPRAQQALHGLPAQQDQQAYTLGSTDVLLSPLEFGVLDSGFVADVEVDHLNNGILWTTGVELSRRERPPTQFRPNQRSHTIAWKAIYEAAINSTRNKSIPDVLNWVRGTLDFCSASGAPLDADGRESWQQLGQEIETKLEACNGLVASGQETRPHFWSAMLSMLIRGCLTLENSSRMATGGGPAADNGAAFGHAEGTTHRNLASGQYSGSAATELALRLLDTDALRTQTINRIMSNEQRQLEAAGQQARRVTRGNPTRVGIGERSRSLNAEVDGPQMSSILGHWVDTTTRAYPNVQFEARALMEQRARDLLSAPVDNRRGVALNPWEKNLFDIIE
nr:DUF4157 domain-containing protein [Streptomyces globisporus]